MHTITIQVIPHPITDSRRRIETEIGAILIITRADRKRLTRPTKGVHHTSRQIRERQCNRVSARGKAREVVSTGCVGGVGDSTDRQTAAGECDHYVLEPGVGVVNAITVAVFEDAVTNAGAEIETEIQRVVRLTRLQRRCLAGAANSVGVASRNGDRRNRVSAWVERTEAVGAARCSGDSGVRCHTRASQFNSHACQSWLASIPNTVTVKVVEDQITEVGWSNESEIDCVNIIARIDGQHNCGRRRVRIPSRDISVIHNHGVLTRQQT